MEGKLTIVESGAGRRLVRGLTLALCLAASGAHPAFGAEPEPPAPPSDLPASDAAASDAPSRAITPPEFVEFVEAPYPEAARALGIDGSVVLRLDIDAEGRVTDAVVVEPAGRGFDEAALGAARRFVFRPARRGDRPVPARLLYRYRFALEARAVEKQVTEAVLSGRIVVSGSDHLLAGARVRLVRDGKPLAERTTAGDGRFTFPALAPGRYRVEVEATGFEPFSADEELSPSEATASEMLDEINFYPGDFSVRYGRALAGVVEAHLRKTRNDGRYHGLLQVDRTTGFVGDHGSSYSAPDRAGTVDLFVTVHDERGGAAWRSFQILVRD